MQLSSQSLALLHHSQLLGLLIQAGILNSYGGLVGQGLEHRQVALVEIVEAVALDVDHAHDLVLSLHDHSHLGASPGARHLHVAAFPADVGNQERPARRGHPTGDAGLVYGQMETLERPLSVAGRARLEHQVWRLNQANLHKVVIECVLYQPSHLLQQPVHSEDGGHVAAHLADDAELLGAALLGRKEARVLNGNGRLVGKGHQEIQIVEIELASTFVLVDDHQASDDLVLDGQRHTGCILDHPGGRFLQQFHTFAVDSLVVLWIGYDGRLVVEGNPAGQPRVQPVATPGDSHSAAHTGYCFVLVTLPIDQVQDSTIGLQERCCLLGDLVQQLVELEGAGDGGRSLLQRRDLGQAALGIGVQASVIDGDGYLPGNRAQ